MEVQTQYGGRKLYTKRIYRVGWYYSRQYATYCGTHWMINIISGEEAGRLLAHAAGVRVGERISRAGKNLVFSIADPALLWKNNMFCVPPVVLAPGIEPVVGNPLVNTRSGGYHKILAVEKKVMRAGGFYSDISPQEAGELFRAVMRRMRW